MWRGAQSRLQFGLLTTTIYRIFSLVAISDDRTPNFTWKKSLNIFGFNLRKQADLGLMASLMFLKTLIIRHHLENAVNPKKIAVHVLFLA